MSMYTHVKIVKFSTLVLLLIFKSLTRNVHNDHEKKIEQISSKNQFNFKQNRARKTVILSTHLITNFTIKRRHWTY